MIKNNNFNLSAFAQVNNNLDYPIKLDNDKRKKSARLENAPKEVQYGRTEHPECSADTKLFFDDIYTNSTQTKKAQVKTVQSGRSMIEMLGVLAIVGVLSIGGIAGYSKAMEMFKNNKMKE